jgi:hypothetical protein
MARAAREARRGASSKRNWRTKDRHDAVTGKALNDAAVRANGFAHQLRISVYAASSPDLSR